MQAAIEQALAVLVGLPMWASGRAADLQWFQFGEPQETTDRHGRARTVGTYALHVQAAWHLAGPARVIVASDDLYFAAGDDPYTRHGDWDDEQQGPNRRDARMAAFEATRATNPPVVTAVAADNLGGIRLSLDDELVLAVFPSTSLEDENWRLLQPWLHGDHFVVTGAGIEE